jgi:hypothetical protein
VADDVRYSWPTIPDMRGRPLRAALVSGSNPPTEPRPFMAGSSNRRRGRYPTRTVSDADGIRRGRYPTRTVSDADGVRRGWCPTRAAGRGNARPGGVVVAGPPGVARGPRVPVT